MIIFSINGTGTTGHQHAKILIQSYNLHTSQKLTQAGSQRPETIKLLEENIGKTLFDIHHSRIIYDPHPRILEIKAKINKWGLIKIKSSAQQRKL